MNDFAIERTQLNDQELIKVVNTRTLDCFSVFPDYGAALNDLTVHGLNIHRTSRTEEDFRANVVREFTGTHLFPFPNRVEDGKYQWNGITYQLPINDKDSHCALHGFVYSKKFQVQSFDEETGRVELRYDYHGELDYFPFPFSMSISYQLIGGDLVIRTEIQNNGNEEFPFGYGFHPYFDVGSVDRTYLLMPSENTWSYSSRFLPIAPFKENRFLKEGLIGDSFLAWCYILESQNESITLRTDKGLIKVSSETLNYCQLYTPENRKYFAVEPQSCLTDAFNNEEGLKSLKPSETAHFDVTISQE